MTPEEKKKILMGIQQTYVGVLPPPEMLAKFNETIPNGADRIMKLAEKQASHRMFIEKTVIGSHGCMGFIGQLFGLIIGLAGLYFGYKIILAGYTVAGSILSGGTLTGLVSLFVIGKKVQSAKLKEKDSKAP